MNKLLQFVVYLWESKFIWVIVFVAVIMTVMLGIAFLFG